MEEKTSVTEVKSNSLLDYFRENSRHVFCDSDVMRETILEDCGRVHDWRNYVPHQIECVWEKLDEVQKRLVMITAETCADREEWD